MKSNLLLLLALVGGIVVGMSGVAPHWMHDESLPMLVLCALIFQVGIGVGAMDNLTAMFRSLDVKMLFLPLFTITGTLLFTLLAFFFFNHESMFDVMALGSGFGYYSLSSVLIAQLKTAAVGATAATQLATIALLTNVARELLSLFSCQVLTRKGGSLAAISTAGIGSMDVCLPSILHASGDQRIVPVAVFHGLILEISIPMLITLFCS